MKNKKVIVFKVSSQFDNDRSEYYWESYCVTFDTLNVTSSMPELYKDIERICRDNKADARITFENR